MTQEIIWQKKSRYALVTCVNNGRGIVVEKEIAPENVNSGNARWVNEASIYFRRRLRELGVPLAEPYICVEANGKAIQTSPYVGLDLDKVFERGEATTAILEKLVRAMNGLLNQKEREVGIDARLSNFCLGPGGDVYYVDTFPPLVKYQGEFIVHFPNPTDQVVIEQELKRKFDPLGIIRRLRFSILAQDAGIDEIQILTVVRCVMGDDFGDEVENFFRTLPVNGCIKSALVDLTIDDSDAIRELALQFMPPKGEARAKYLSEVFDFSSHFCPLKMTTEERIDHIRDFFFQK